MCLRKNAAALAAFCIASATCIAAPPAARRRPGRPGAPPRAARWHCRRAPGRTTRSTIEWWYFNSFLTTEGGKRYAVVASFFRTGLGAQKGTT